MKKHKKIILIIAIFLVIVCLGLAIYFYINPAEIKLNSKKDAENYIEKINSFILKGKTNDEYNRIFKYKIDKNLIILGEDAYQNQKPSKEIIKKYNLEEYVKEHEKLIKNLESKIKDNFDVKVMKTSDYENKFNNTINIKTFYYSSYISDLKTIESDIVFLAGMDYTDTNLTEKEEADRYKAKVKAMKIIDEYLDRYVNKNETLSIEVYLKDKKSSKCVNEIKWYLTNIVGYNYEKAPKYDSNRINEYVSKIGNKNVLDL